MYENVNYEYANGTNKNLIIKVLSKQTLPRALPTQDVSTDSYEDNKTARLRLLQENI